MSRKNTLLRQEVARRRNRVRRLERRREARDRATFLGIRHKLLELADEVEMTKGRKVELVAAVEEWLDKKIEPKSAIGEWLSDIAIDIAAAVVVEIWQATEQRLVERLDDARKKLAEAEAKLEAAQ